GVAAAVVVFGGSGVVCSEDGGPWCSMAAGVVVLTVGRRRLRERWRRVTESDLGDRIDRTMDMTIDQQVALDEAIVPHASKLRIGKRNFRLKSNIFSKESTLQLVYDVLRVTPFYKGLYHKRNVDFAYLLWKDFIYQIEHKDAKKRNEMYYPMFTKVIVHYFLSNDPSIPRRNKVNRHYVRDDQSLVAIGATPPKTKASVWKTKSSSDTTVTPPPTAAAGTRLSTSAKGKQPAKASKAKSLTALSEVAMIEAEQLKLATKRSLQQTHIS
nr:hypothetical protein [Tanacetum cinerariifolium]